MTVSDATARAVGMDRRAQASQVQAIRTKAEQLTRLKLPADTGVLEIAIYRGPDLNTVLAPVALPQRGTQMARQLVIEEQLFTALEVA